MPGTAPIQPDWETPLPAPAKINLFLHVVGRRPDGYHLLQTAFRMLARWDSLSFSPREDGEIRLARPLPGVPAESDLCVRAARLLRDASGGKRGVTISLDKHLPMGGGLGGGSSDAATVLLALNRLWQVGLPRERLMELGLALGADVPFFIFGRNAFAEGVGEKLQPLCLPEAWYLVVEPAVSVPTAEIFSAQDLTRDTEFIKIADFPAEGGASFGHNDLEPVACRLYPAVAQALGWLRQFGGARMSGSGACVFAEYASEAEALAAMKHLPENWKAWVARSLDEHPLVACAG
ncbi:MAG: 4-(cytidine 5'-diphospho)-2-C-methyl-D-erythritol kinase [Rhodocyclaceae bacterium]|nr:4-(cytidine 5'-diphospho)-2-C-methyl-D-erythritol kinase [Rhodocyclaceae bacterium]